MSDKTHLTRLCSDAGECVAFGKERPAIIKYFERFENLTLIKEPITIIGKGVNGVVASIIFEKNNYKIATALKTPTSNDKIYYEAYIGMNYINNLCTYFPCFVYTYGLYKHALTRDGIPNDHKYDETTRVSRLVSRKNIIFKDFLLVMNPNLSNLDDACTRGNNMSLLTECIQNPIHMYKYINEIITDEYHLSVTLPQLFYQVYSVLM